MPLKSVRIMAALGVALLTTTTMAWAQTAYVSEDTRLLPTYPFADPNRVPILTGDERLYPYHSFEGYAHEPVSRPWKVVTLANEHIEVYVLPEVGGKVWGAVVKRSGHEFIYRNEVMKFRNIALRGPWTSGGIEFNFGVIGHTPATATPVDYLTRQNPDGSASVFVGGMDLPSRTHWRVEVRLPADRAYFETNVLWHNPTTLEQPYYNWMTGAAVARDDLVMSIPGNAYLEHPGAERSWPDDASGRHLPLYDENRFGGNKSYHVVGERNGFFGGYYRDGGYGFGHWSRYEDMPGQKLWLWALSRQGGIWEDLLTDDDGQYIEFQAGRLLVQYSPGADVNPISQVGFDPGATDRWTETWFPVEGLGGLTAASREGAMFVQRTGSRVVVRAHSFGEAVDTLRVSSGDRIVAEIPLTLYPLEPVERALDLPSEGHFVVELAGLGLVHHSDPAELSLSRPFSTDPEAVARIPEADRLVEAARELVQGRELGRARGLVEAGLAEEPWNREGLLVLADLEYRRGRYRAGLVHVDRLLQLDAYDAEANFLAGNLHRALGQTVDAAEAFGWSARAMAFRSVSYVQLAELALADGRGLEAMRYAGLATDYDRYNLAARQVSAIAVRRMGEADRAATERAAIVEIDALSHFVRAERYLDRREPRAGEELLDGLRGEYPEQELLELAINYARRGATDDAGALLALALRRHTSPLLGAWAGWLARSPELLPSAPDPSFVFPYRPETLPVLEWAAESTDHWVWRYLLALNLWGRDRAAEAAALLEEMGDAPDFGPAYVTRAHLLSEELGRDPEADLRRAVELDPGDRLLRIHLVQHLLEARRWEDATAVTGQARRDFPDDFNLDLLHVRALNELGRVEQSIEILDGIRVLPSEHAGASHALFEQAHVAAALDALGRGEHRGAADHVTTAMTWPERLGQGRPYEPEERLARYVSGLALRGAGDGEGAGGAFTAVIDATGGAVSDRAGLVGIPAAVALGRSSELGAWTIDEGTDVGRLAATMIAAALRGEDPGTTVARLANGFNSVFDDLDGRLLLRALTYAP